MLILAIILCSTLAIFVPVPALAHVKWFLGASEAEILSQPKPDLFTHPGVENISILFIGLVALFVSILIGQRFRHARFNQALLRLGRFLEPAVNLVIGVTTGIMLIHCALHHVYLAPNLVAPEYLKHFVRCLQFATGVGLILGLFTRFWAICLMTMFVISFAFFPLSDSLDLLPLYGISLYLLLRGRQPFGLDRFLKLSPCDSIAVQNLAHNCLRWGMGLAGYPALG